MNLLVLNAGSGSQACTLFRLGDALPDEPPAPAWEARVETTSVEGRAVRRDLSVTTNGQTAEESQIPVDMAAGDVLAMLLKRLWQEDRVVDDPSDIAAVGHRVVHGGRDFTQATLIDTHVEAAIAKLSAFAPLHNPHNLEGLRIARGLFPHARQIAVFDTSFHQGLPEAAATYPGPAAWLDHGIRRYGFHGTSFRWSLDQAARILKRPAAELRLVICHLGGGCSLAAVKGGRSVDTTMGFTPLDGIAMSTRSGSVDPGILFYLLRQGVGVDDLEQVLNKKSGLTGLSGLAGDSRIVEAEAADGDPHAELALDVFVHRLSAGIGQMLAALGERPDAIVFTDVIGQGSPDIRRRACEPFHFIGLQIDAARNAASPEDSDISTAGSDVKVLIVKAREAWQIARDCHKLLI